MFEFVRLVPQFLPYHSHERTLQTPTYHKIRPFYQISMNSTSVMSTTARMRTAPWLSTSALDCVLGYVLIGVIPDQPVVKTKQAYVSNSYDVIETMYVRVRGHNLT